MDDTKDTIKYKHAGRDNNPELVISQADSIVLLAKNFANVDVNRKMVIHP